MKACRRRVTKEVSGYSEPPSTRPGWRSRRGRTPARRGRHTAGPPLRIDRRLAHPVYLPTLAAVADEGTVSRTVARQSARMPPRRRGGAPGNDPDSRRHPSRVVDRRPTRVQRGQSRCPATSDRSRDNPARSAPRLAGAARRRPTTRRRNLPRIRSSPHHPPIRVRPHRGIRHVAAARGPTTLSHRGSTGKVDADRFLAGVIWRPHRRPRAYLPGGRSIRMATRMIGSGI